MKRIKNQGLQRICLTLFAFFVLSVSGVLAQTVIKGKVVDSDNVPLPGVNVILKGTTTGTITDLDGNFEITITSAEDVIQFSMIGMLSEEVVVGSQSVIDMVLSEDMVGLEEVIVVGYGVMKKSDISGSIASVGEEEITEVKTLNAMQGLQGKMAGVDITSDGGRTGSGVNVLIRGKRSITASNEPLYIVDGIPYGSGIDLNPNDIESIEVLKDASSTAVYGSRGANGVVLVTTKKGKAGHSKVYFNTFYGVTQPYQKVPVFDRDGYIDAKRQAYTTYDDEWNPTTAPDESIFQGNEEIGLLEGTETDWQDITTQNGIRQDYQLGVSGGNDKTTYNISLSYSDEKGVTLADDYKRGSFKLNLDTKVKDWLTVGGSSLMILSQRDGRGVRFTDAVLSSPIVASHDSTGKYIYEANLPNPRKNPLAFTDDSQQRSKQRILSNVYSQINFSPALNFRTSLGLILDFEREGWAYPEKGEDVDTPEAGVTNLNKLDYTWTNLLNYNQSFGVHSVSAMLGHEVRYDRQEDYYMKGDWPTFPRTLWWNMGGVQAGTQIMETGLIEKKLVSVFARASYNYNNLVIVNGTMRADGASQLAEGNKWDYFPSISTALRLKQFSALQSIEKLSDLKLRVGYGVSGNASVPAYATNSRLNVPPIYYQFGNSGAESINPGYRPEFLSSETLTWEITKQYNLGLDVGLFANRLSFNIDAYSGNTTNNILPVRLPISTGFFSITTNSATVETKGIELMLSSTNINRGGFVWDMSITYGMERDKVTEISPGVTRDIANNLFVGESMDVVYDYNMIGIWQIDEADEAAIYSMSPGDIKVQNIDGDTILGEKDRMFIGNERPKWSGSWINTFRYKGFDFTVNMYARMGQMIDADAYSFDPRMLNNMITHNYWTPTNPSNEAPRLDANQAEAFYEDLLKYRDGSYVKIKNITFGYTFPSELLERAKIAKLRLYASSENPFLLYSTLDKGVDPERNGGISWPMARTFVFGLNIEF